MILDYFVSRFARVGILDCLPQSNRIIEEAATVGTAVAFFIKQIGLA